MSKVATAGAAGETAPEQQTKVEETKPTAETAPTTRERVKADDLPPDALKARLEAEREKARRDVLAELGVGDTKDAKAALDELKRRQDAEKTAAERMQAKLAELEGKQGIFQRVSEALARRAAAELSQLTEAQRAYVQKTAGDDHLRQIDTIDSMRDAGLLQAALAQTPPAADSVTDGEVKQQLATTAPGATAPQQGHVSPVDHTARYRSLKSTNPIAAAAYLQRHIGGIDLSQ